MIFTVFTHLDHAIPVFVPGWNTVLTCRLTSQYITVVLALIQNPSYITYVWHRLWFSDALVMLSQNTVVTCLLASQYVAVELALTQNPSCIHEHDILPGFQTPWPCYLHIHSQLKYCFYSCLLTSQYMTSISPHTEPLLHYVCMTSYMVSTCLDHAILKFIPG